MAAEQRGLHSRHTGCFSPSYDALRLNSYVWIQSDASSILYQVTTIEAHSFLTIGPQRNVMVIPWQKCWNPTGEPKCSSFRVMSSGLDKYCIHSLIKIKMNKISLGMDNWFHPTLYNECNYISTLGFKLIHVSERGPRTLAAKVLTGHFLSRELY